eukprot:CAMPEP_0184692700 /NCGR_PEP_ID=MMETSP0313-20130426/1068_1 /TAXON_ID=2792 /ORGANISM="Porphyridium aerugineum, Strain SAG 1380-2" /LENGTH=394 /DNA_ID=CAMNT_0027150549 /DNA_START=36 /DNA_END=1220 /DNA_ORIENTATION=+
MTAFILTPSYSNQSVQFGWLKPKRFVVARWQVSSYGARAVIRTMASQDIDTNTSASVSGSSSTSASTLTTPVESVPTTGLYQCITCRNELTAQSSSEIVNTSCPTCGQTYTNVPRLSQVADMTISDKSSSSLLETLVNQYILGNRAPVRQELFRSPLVSFLYERGWRNQFRYSGFPGIDEEYLLMKKWFAETESAKDKNKGSKFRLVDSIMNEPLLGTVMDLSCGSGLMARKMIQGQDFQRVVAVDYSETMLREAMTRIKNSFPGSSGSSSSLNRTRSASSYNMTKYDLVRADVANLPFTDNSFDWIHIGAALHCYPRVQDGLSSCYRVLKPGGKIFATTFLWVFDNVRSGAPQDVRFFDREELGYLFKAAGFENVSVERRQSCAIIRAQKKRE